MNSQSYESACKMYASDLAHLRGESKKYICSIAGNEISTRGNFFLQTRIDYENMVSKLIRVSRVM
jgi:hypothetical protein